MKTTTKVFLMLLVMASMLTFTSCKKEPQIVGKWKCTNDLMIEGDHQFADSPSIGQIWEFKENGELLKEGEGRAYAYSIEGDNLTITDTVTFPDGIQMFSQTAIIQILTETQLSLSFEYQGANELIVPRNMGFNRL